MIILGIDIETTGLDPKVDEVTEIAYVLYDLAARTKLFTLSSLVKGAKEIPADIVKLTGITNEMRGKWGTDKAVIKPNLMSVVQECDYICAHNAAFEQSFVGFLGKPWVDTVTDLPFPDEMTTRKLTHLAAEHFVYLGGAHRALADVETMLAVASKYDVEVVKKYADSPTIVVQACVSFDEKDLAKERGYRWNPKSKVWWKSLKEFQLVDERREAGFAVQELVEENDV